ncbi:MAG: methyltransferase domain-containing protein [Burkholderiales bacterium]|nr:methyltransferase domain-containing protein [Burkholderiales bacterium]
MARAPAAAWRHAAVTAPAPGWLDAAAARRAMTRAARRGHAPDPFAAEIARRMAERLELVRLAPQRVLDVRCGPTAGGDEALHARYPRAEHVTLEPVPPAPRARPGWAARLARPFASRTGRIACADAGGLPFPPSAFELVWSNLALAAYDDPAAVLREWHRVLAVDGLLMFTTVGPDTLKELRAAFAFEAPPHVHPFADMHDIGDMLVGAGFADPVIDMEMVTLTYAAFDDLLGDLRRAGATNAHAARRRGLTGRGTWSRARRAYEALARDGGNARRLPATVEVVYGHAWKPAPRVAADGRQIIRFDARGPHRRRN